MSQVYHSYETEPTGAACEGGDEHDPCIQALGYCPYCQDALPYPAT